MDRKLLATGNTAQIFEIAPDKVLKLFKKGYSRQEAANEYANGQLILRHQMPVPQLYEEVEMDGRFGYLMEFIHGKSLCDLLTGENTFMQAMKLFTDCHKKWLSNSSAEVISYKTWITRCLSGKAPSDEIKRLTGVLPEGNALCHGDFHPLNIIVTDQGSPVVIDFANVCSAPKEYDIARTCFLLKEALPESPISDIYLQMMETDMEEIQIYYNAIKSFRSYETRQ